MQKSTAAEISLLEKLYPDIGVREIIRSVHEDRSKETEAMSTSYSFLDSKKNVIFNSGHQACFGQLWTNWKMKSKARYLSYLPKYSTKGPNKAKRIRFIELGQEMGILPDDMEPKDIYTNGVMIDILDPDLTLGKLYMQLTYLRWLREAPSLVGNILRLVDDAGRDFWAAAVFCHKYNCTRVDHSLLPFSAGYPSGGHRNEVDRSLGLVMRMHKATVAPSLVDKRKVVKLLKDGKDMRWKWHAEVTKPEKHLLLKDRLMLLSSELHPLIYSGSVEKASEMIKTLEKRESHVKFDRQADSGR
jgi:hypothetical protein